MESIFPFYDLDDRILFSEFNDGNLPFSSYSGDLFNPFCEDVDSDSVSPDEIHNTNLRYKISQSHYCDVDKFKDVLSSESSSLNCVFLNIRSIPSNLEEFVNDFSVSREHLDFICFAETRLSESISSLYNINGYKIFSNPRNSSGGGVCIYARSKYRANIIESISLTSEVIETMFIKYRLNSKNFVVGCIYRPPSADISLFLEEISRIITHVYSNVRDVNLILLGDFNINLLSQVRNSPSLELEALMYSLGMFPLVLRPTRIGGSSATLIDHIWANNIDNVIGNGVIISNISDHFPVFARWSTNKAPRDTHTIVYKRRNDFCKFSTLVASHNWGDIHSCNSAENAYNMFASVLSSYYDEACPVQMRVIKKVDMEKPYIDSEIKRIINEKNKLERLCITKPITYGRKFREARAKVRKLVKKSREQYFQNKIDSCSSDSRRTWQTINGLLGRKCRSSETTDFDVNGELVSDPLTIANGFNTYFSSVGENLSRDFGGDGDYSRFLEHSNDILDFDLTNDAEIVEVVTNLRDASPGHDNLPMRIFKENLTVISSVITHICNLSLSTGVYPESLMVGKVTCIYKSGDPSLFSNYRPISVLCAFSKILEKLVTLRLVNHFDSHDLFTNSQFGFRAGLSTENAIHSILSPIYDAFESGKIACGVFIDLAKAFDSLDRDILIDKLSYYGIVGNCLTWFESYFSRRRQYVCYGGACSDMLPVNYGVPQGSILGPVLFIIFMNDIPRCTSLLNFVIYADDTNVYLTSDNINEAFDVVNEGLRGVSGWLRVNRLTVNASKSQYIVFRRKQRVLPGATHDLYLNNERLERVSSVKFLGVYLDEHLLFTAHVTYVLKKTSKYLPILYKIRRSLNRNTLKLIYNSLIHANLMYCISTWGFCYRNRFNLLLVLQKKLVRAITFGTSFSGSVPLFRDLNLLPLDHLSIYSVNVFVHKTLLNSSSSALFEIYIADAYNTRLSNSNSLSIPNIISTHSRQSIRWTGARCWNDLPQGLREETMHKSFKSKLKKYLVSRI